MPPLLEVRGATKIYGGGMFTRHEKTVALKMLRPEKAADPMFRKRLEAEARAAATLNHPAIAALLDFEANGETPFLIYEFVKGKTLRVMQDERALSLRDVLSIFIGIRNSQDISEALCFVRIQFRAYAGQRYSPRGRCSYRIQIENALKT